MNRVGLKTPVIFLMLNMKLDVMNYETINRIKNIVDSRYLDLAYLE